MLCTEYGCAGLVGVFSFSLRATSPSSNAAFCSSKLKLSDGNVRVVRGKLCSAHWSARRMCRRLDAPARNAVGLVRNRDSLRPVLDGMVAMTHDKWIGL